MSTRDRNRRNHRRYPFGRDVRVVAAGREHIVHVQDISRGGAALLLNTSIDNDAFVDLHVEGFGRISSQVVRRFDNGVGVEFDLGDDAKAAMAAADGKAPPTKDDPLTDTVRKFLDFIDTLKGQ